MYDSIKVSRTKTIDQTTSLIAKNDEFKAQLQEKGFAIAALKNELRKLKGNSERHSPLAQQRLKVNPQIVQKKISLTNVKAKKALDVSAGTLLSTEDVCSHQFRPRYSSMVSAENNTSGPVPQCSKRRLIVADQASVFMEMTSFSQSFILVLHQMTSDHNRSELRIQDHSNEPSSSKLVPKVVPLGVKTATSRQELELLFHHHIAMLRTTGK
ncbi:hypothetical protein Tco_0915556 [Tanacetum coccineum]